MISYFNHKDTENQAVVDFISSYISKYGEETMNQFGASAYDSIYAIFGALKKAVAEGETVTVNMSASDFCEILKKQFNGDYIYENGVTGKSISWDETGYVNKQGVWYIIKDNSATD